MLYFSFARLQTTVILLLILALLLLDTLSIEAKKSKNKRSRQVSHHKRHHHNNKHKTHLHKKPSSHSNPNPNPNPNNTNNNNENSLSQIAQQTQAQAPTTSSFGDGEQDKSLYPDYCWFDGLENRILVEYPHLYDLVKVHDVKLNKEKDLFKAVELHKEIFMKIYEFELEKFYSQTGGNNVLGRSRSAQSTNGIDRPEKRAAYKLFDLWANTPGDFERKQDDYSNYLEPYLIQTQIEFWSYCLDDRLGCQEVLNQLSILAGQQELGPVELLQVSLNIIMLMNSYKADLLLEKLLERNVIKLNEFEEQFNVHDDEERVYQMILENVVDLIERDEDFNEASFHYTFTKTNKIDRYLDPKIESFFKNKIKQFSNDDVKLANNDFHHQ